MALEFYKITNLSNDTKMFAYFSGSTPTDDETNAITYTIQIQGLNNEQVVQSYAEPINIPIGTSEEIFTSNNFNPNPGYAWLWNDGSKVKYIKIGHSSANNFNISPYISDTRILSFAMVGAKDGNGNFMYNPTASQHVEDYYLSNSTKRGNHSFLVIEQPPSSNAVSDLTAGQRNFNFSAEGNYRYYATSSGNITEPISQSGYTASIAQGYFPKNVEDFGTLQFIRGWAGANFYIDGNLVPIGGDLTDHLFNFNTGSTERDYDNLFPYTASSLPWFINAPSSSFEIEESNFGVYSGQDRSIKIGPSFRNTSSESSYGEAVYGDSEFEYGGSGADDFISYYYKEDTNEILIYDPGNIINEDKKPSPLYYPSTKYTEILVGVGNPQTYTTTEGHEIVVGNGNELSVFRGQQTEGSGDNNAWNYNRYLHRPYKIYLLSVTGSNGNPSRIETAYVSFSSSLSRDRIDGRYIFGTSTNTDLSLTASVTLTASNSLPVPPSEYGDSEYSNDLYGGGFLQPDQTWQTASLHLYIAAPNSTPGTILTSSVLYIDDINTDNTISLRTPLSASNILAGSSLRLAISVNTGSLNASVNSSLLLVDYSMSIAGPVPAISDLVPTYLDNILLTPEDCNPFEGSALESSPNNVVMEVDYSSGSLIPINQKQLLEGTAKKSPIPASHYSALASSGIRYEGSFSTSEVYNKFTEGDVGTYGKVPTVEINKAFSAYFNRIYDTYPLLNQKTSLEIKYIIDENGNAGNPRIGEYNFFNLEGSLSEGENAKIAITDKESEVLYPLNALKPIFKTGLKVTPILYSQAAAKAYTSSIFITGKEPLNDDPVTFKDYSFRAFETVSSARVRNFSSQQLSPETVVTASGENVFCPYTSSETVANNGSGQEGDTNLPITDTSGSQGAGNGKPLSDTYQYKVNYTFETSNIRETKTQNGKKGIPGRKKKQSPDVGDFRMFMRRNGSKARMVIESIYCDAVHRNPNTSTGLEVKSFNAQTSAISTDIHQESNKDLRIHFNSNRFQSALNAAGAGGSDIRDGGSLIKIRWRVKTKLKTTGGSGASPIKQGDELKTFVQGDMHHSSGGINDFRQQWFFYSTSTGDYPGAADIQILLEGTKSLPSPAVSASYWAFTGSSGEMIEMLSENGNIAYGRTGFKQKYFPYSSGSVGSGSYNGYVEGDVEEGINESQTWTSVFQQNDDFSSGYEPDFLTFPPIDYDWEVFTGDEIRFQNDEEEVYKIIEVLSPATQPAINGEDIGRLKLVLDRPVNPSVNLDFFLIRRYIKDEGNLIIDFPKPYGVPLSPISATGLAFPEFPVRELNTNPDEVLKNLLEQKLIE
jgi:hypothetical protein